MELVDVVTQLAPFLEDWTEHHRRFSHTPGIQVAVRVGDQLCASFAVGTSNEATGEPLTTRHLFHVASHSKTFTATAVMQMVEAGRLRLDDPLAAWVPELDGSPAAQYTVRELLGHQSGINRDGAEADYWQLDDDFPDRRRLVQLARADAVWHPNQFFKYSNVGYSLLGLVIEAASGESYEDYVTAHVITPLGLANTGPEVPVERRGELAGAHGIVLHPDDARPVLPHVPSNAEAAATGFYSTAEDVSRYMACHAFGREELVSDASKRLMQRRESRITRGHERFYGLGFIMRELNGRMLVGHSGGWPGHITNTWLDPETGLCVSVLTNRLGGPATDLSTAIVDLVDMVVRAEASGPAEHALGVDPDTFTGRYASMWGVTDVALLGTRLYALDLSTLQPSAWAEPLEVIDAVTLRGPAEDSFGAAGEPWHFTRTGRGFVTSVRQGGMTSLPLAEWARRQAEQRATAAADDDVPAPAPKASRTTPVREAGTSRTGASKKKGKAARKG